MEPEAFAGFYEIPYFKTNYFNNVANSDNVLTFQNVNLYNSYYSTIAVNFEYLFATYNVTTGVGSEPPTNSLFNMENMQALVSLGQTTPNILVETNQTFGVNFTLS